MKRPVRLAVDRTACDGRGICAELLPELIRLDDWGFPILSPEPVPAELRALAEDAVGACPRLAVHLADVSRPRRPDTPDRRRGT